MSRAEQVAELLRKVGKERLMRLEELADPQFEALQRLAMVRGEGVAAVYAVLVSLVSYRLTMRGEEWWSCLAEFASRGRESSVSGIAREVEEFLRSCKGAALSREAKIERVRRAASGARPQLERLLRDPSALYESPGELVRALSAALGAESWRKTLVFTVKMAYYATRKRGENRVVDYELPLPVDSRVACATYSSELVAARSFREIMSKPRPAQQAWLEVSRRAGIPSVNLDTLLWLTGWAPRDLEIHRAHEEVARILSAVMGYPEALQIARGLYLRSCL
ncbi:MAG: N-glycosylase/DNA lyase [Acidilobaceae archaeon]|nr:N-glycosylase/DNA lyase [Acidilobaceae archaeon]MDW7974726.1 N-glycosylase/DNA lyase [Sulfolobales archaeon]